MVVAGLFFGCGETTDPAASAPPPGSNAHDRSNALPADEIVFGNNVTSNFEIYAMAPDGRHLRQLTDAPAYDCWWPRISPDREQILFYQAPFGEGGDYEVAELMIMNADGTAVTVLREIFTDG